MKKINNIKLYKSELNVVTPIHIGYGEYGNYSSEKYIIKNNKIYILKPDSNECNDLIKTNSPLKDLEIEKLSSKKIRELMQLSNFITTANDLLDYTYQLDFFGDVTDDMNINGFIKNYYGTPYIPGSSIKGAIRKALVFELDKINNVDSIPLSNAIMNGLRVSDSENISYDDVIVCQKYYFSNLYKDGLKSDNPFVYLEMIKPNTKIQFEIAITREFDDFIKKVSGNDNDALKTLLFYTKNNSIEVLKKYEDYDINKFNQNIIDTKKFFESDNPKMKNKSVKSFGELKNLNINYNGVEPIKYKNFNDYHSNIMLGGGNGAISKQSYKDLVSTNSNDNQKDNNDETEIYPKTLKLVKTKENNYAPIGLCNIEVIAER